MKDADPANPIPPSSPTCARDLPASPVHDDWLLDIFAAGADTHVPALGVLCDCDRCLLQRERLREDPFVPGFSVSGEDLRNVVTMPPLRTQAIRDPVTVVDLAEARAKAMPHGHVVTAVPIPAGAHIRWQPGSEREHDRLEITSAEGKSLLHAQPFADHLRRVPPPTFREQVDAYVDGLLPKHPLARLVVVGVLGFGSGVAIMSVVKAVMS